MNYPVYKPCRWCGRNLSWTERAAHEAHCPKNRLCATCAFCGAWVNLREEFTSHVTAICPNRPNIPPDHQVCSGCWRVLPIAAFSREQRGANSLKNRCKQCRAAYLKKQYRESPEFRRQHRSGNLQRWYGIDHDEYDAMVAAQGGKCAICHLPPKCTNSKDQRLFVDHDHTTGKIRGLLCYHCNFALGLFQDDAGILLAAIDYLRRHQKIHLVS